MQLCGAPRATSLGRSPGAAAPRRAGPPPPRVAAPPAPETAADPHVPPLSPEVAAAVAEAGVDFSVSALRWLPDAARARALAKKANKFEKVKNARCGSLVWQEVEEVAALIRAGETSWEDLALDDVDVRYKWAGLFHRRKRTPGRFMMRLKVPSGELTAEQLRFLDAAISEYGADGCADITTRANVQLRGVLLEDAAGIMAGLRERGLTSVQTGMDNVRNITTSPISGVDPHELLDARPLAAAVDAMITASGLGNPALCNLPRKINIGLSTSRDDFAHCHINDVGLKAAVDAATGEVGFNVELGGYFSIKRNTMSMSGDTFLSQAQVVPYCQALLEVFRDHGGREDRQKARLMWLVEEWGVDRFRAELEARMGAAGPLRRGLHVEQADAWARRDVMGVHAARQAGFSWVGAVVPAGRLLPGDFAALADAAERHGDGTVRLTVEENVVLPNVPDANLAALALEPIFQRFPIGGGPLLRGLVSCTGAQFCGVALIETKNRALRVVEALESELDIPAAVRVHWTGCPNSCGQAQVADIGLMGAPAKLDGKAVEGVKIMVGGTVGENPTLAADFEKSVPCDEAHLLPALRAILIDRFGATPKAAAA
jgi:ferredoxin-nitrite reductase